MNEFPRTFHSHARRVSSCKTLVKSFFFFPEFRPQLELFLSEVNNRETIVAIGVNNDTYCLQKRIEKFPLVRDRFQAKSSISLLSKERIKREGKETIKSVKLFTISSVSVHLIILIWQLVPNGNVQLITWSS